VSWARLIWYWLTSRTARAGLVRLRTVRRLLRQQRDLLEPAALAELIAARQAFARVWLDRAEPAVLRRQMDRLAEKTGRFVQDPSARWGYETLDLLLVAFVVILAIRTFFVQPMSIPSGSMQPTLYGITTEDLRGRSDGGRPRLLRRVVDRWVFGRSYCHVVARARGRITRIEPPEPIFKWPAFLRSWRKQRFQIGATWHTIWFMPAELPNPLGLNPDRLLFVLAGVDAAHEFQPGEEVINLAVNAGDHLLVDRLTFNFRQPQRGEIVVFDTHGIPGVHESAVYIKRLVGLPEERLRIGDDRHVVVNGRRLDADTPHFANVYNFSGPPRENYYSGHVNDRVAQRNGIKRGTLAPLFATGRTEFQVRPGHFLVLGDNTLNSFDGRRWGDFAQELVLGRCLLVYWPLSDRLGWTSD
jgi:signal peptidase I